MMHSAEISQKPLEHICVKHNFTTRKAYFFQIKQTANDNALTCPEQPTVTLAYSDCVERLSSNIQWAVLNEEVCLIQREEVDRERERNGLQIIHRDYQSQQLQCFHWWETMLPHSLIQMTWKTTAAAIKRSAIKKKDK